MPSDEAENETRDRHITLLADRRRVEYAVRLSGIGFWYCDLPFDELIWDERVKSHFFLPPDARVTIDIFYDRIVPDDRARTRAAIEQSIQDKAQYDIVYRTHDPATGAVKWIRAMGGTTYAPDGSPTRFDGVTVDVSSQKREEERLLSLLEHVPAIVNVLRGPDLVWSFAHPKALEGMKKTRDILGRPLLETVPEMAEQPYYARLRKVYETGEPFTQQEAFAWHIVDGQRVERYWTSVYLPVRDASGAIEGVMTFDLDVTEQVRARQDLERASRAKDEFLATMSHELRTPLNAMLGWATLLRADHSNPAKLERGLTVIERNAQAQARLVSDLLDMSRIVSGKLLLSPKKVRVSTPIHAAADVVRPAAEAKGVRLVVDLDPDLGDTLADADRLQQIVWNLLANAVRFTPRQGSVTVKAHRIDSSIAIEVVDTGEGIPPEHLAHIFERFRQVDSSTTRAHGGLGIGLAIVRHLVEAHGGHVTAKSDGLGRGASFHVTLPIHSVVTTLEAEVSSVDAAASAKILDVGAMSLRGLRVLAVDDDQDSLDLVRVALEDAGATVFAATSAKAALAASGPFDVIVSDIGMPETDGYTLMRQVRAQRADRETPAIALTAYARAEDAERALRSGYQEHLSKPVDVRQLLAAVERRTRPRTTPQQ